MATRVCYQRTCHQQVDDPPGGYPLQSSIDEHNSKLDGSPADHLACNQAHHEIELSPKHTSSPRTRLSISCRAKAAGGLLLCWELRAGRAAAVAWSREARSWATVSFSLMQGRADGQGGACFEVSAVGGGVGGHRWVGEAAGLAGDAHRDGAETEDEQVPLPM